MALDKRSPVMMVVVVVVVLEVVAIAGVMRPEVRPELSAPFLGGRSASLAARSNKFVVPVALDSPERAEQTRATR